MSRGWMTIVGVCVSQCLHTIPIESDQSNVNQPCDLPSPPSEDSLSPITSLLYHALHLFLSENTTQVVPCIAGLTFSAQTVTWSHPLPTG